MEFCLSESWVSGHRAKGKGEERGRLQEVSVYVRAHREEAVAAPHTENASCCVHSGPRGGSRPVLTKPSQGGEGIRLLIVVSAHRVHRGPRPLQDVLLAVEVPGYALPQLGHPAELAHHAVVAHVHLLVVDVPDHKPHVLCPIGEVALDHVLVHEISCGGTRSALGRSRERRLPPSPPPPAGDLTPHGASGWDYARSLGPREPPKGILP